MTCCKDDNGVFGRQQIHTLPQFKALVVVVTGVTLGATEDEGAGVGACEKKLGDGIASEVWVLPR
jgi:hypothetical protein